MNWIEHLRIHHAARLYARHLPAELAKGWGRSETYTSDQIATVIAKLRGKKRYAIIAYAAFLNEANFEALIGTQSVLTYDEARKLFFRYADKRFLSPYAHNPMTEAEAINRHGLH